MLALSLMWLKEQRSVCALVLAIVKGAQTSCAYDKVILIACGSIVNFLLHPHGCCDHVFFKLQVLAL